MEPERHEIVVPQCPIKMRAAFLALSSFITRGRMGARKAALIWMKNSNFDRTSQYLSVRISRVTYFKRQTKLQVQVHTDQLRHKIATQYYPRTFSRDGFIRSKSITGQAERTGKSVLQLSR